MNYHGVENKKLTSKTYLQRAQKKCWHHQYLHSNITSQLTVPKDKMGGIVTGQTSKCHDSEQQLGKNYQFT